MRTDETDLLSRTQIFQSMCQHTRTKPWIETRKTFNGAVENDGAPIAYATHVSEPEERAEQARRDPSPSPMPAVNNRTNRQRFRNQGRRPARIRRPTWLHHWGIALVIVISVVVAVVVTVVVKMPNNGATEPLPSPPVPHQVAPPMAPLPSRAPAIATTIAPSPLIPDTVPPTTFSFDSTASRATDIVNYLNSVFPRDSGRLNHEWESLLGKEEVKLLLLLVRAFLVSPQLRQRWRAVWEQ
jgi:hypothetical protein